MKALTFQEAVDQLVEKLSQVDEKGPLMQSVEHRRLTCHTVVAGLAFVFGVEVWGTDTSNQTFLRVESRISRTT